MLNTLLSYEGYKIYHLYVKKLEEEIYVEIFKEFQNDRRGEDVY